MDDTEKDLICDTLTWLVVVNTSTTFLSSNMDNNKDREKIAKQIAKTNDLIRKKYRA